MKFDELLTKHRSESQSTADKGFRFEQHMRGYLLTDPIYANQFDTVWRWTDFSYKDSKSCRDTGIDWVARNRVNRPEGTWRFARI